MSDESTSVDLTAEVSVPEGEVSREELVKIFEDARKGGDEEPGEPAVEPAKVVEPPKESVSARILANRKAESRAKADREAAATEREAIKAERAELAEAKAASEALKAAKLSPSRALELLGMSPKEFLESLATEHEPEAIAKREVRDQLAKTQPEVERLAMELRALKDERAAEVQARRHAEIQTAYTTEGNAFVEHVAANAEKYPALVESMTPQQFVDAGFACLEEPVGKTKGGKVITRLDAFMADSDGVPPTNDDIAEFLEHRAQPVFQARNAWRERLGKSAPIPSQGSSAIQGQPVTAAKPRTLTNGASATNASAPKPWSQADADAESVRLIQQLHASRQ